MVEEFVVAGVVQHAILGCTLQPERCRATAIEVECVVATQNFNQVGQLGNTHTIGIARRATIHREQHHRAVGLGVDGTARVACVDKTFAARAPVAEFTLVKHHRTRRQHGATLALVSLLDCFVPVDNLYTALVLAHSSVYSVFELRVRSVVDNLSAYLVETYRVTLLHIVVGAIDGRHSSVFLGLLAGVAEPERKRKIIGKEFIEVFADEARKLEGISFLAQGTIYPDILESIKQAEGKKAVKSHHNVGGLPDDLQFELVEPIKLLYKDEVRVVGEALGLPHSMVYRQPFPGPGLGVRCLGAITRDRLHALREADAILREEFENCGLNEKVWQYFIAVPDIKSVGVKDESRYEGWPAIIRAVNTKDAMSATIEEIPYAVLHKVTDRITHEVDGINRVLYDLTPKPIGTIEWE